MYGSWTEWTSFLTLFKALLLLLCLLVRLFPINVKPTEPMGARFYIKSHDHREGFVSGGSYVMLPQKKSTFTFMRRKIATRKGGTKRP